MFSARVSILPRPPTHCRMRLYSPLETALVGKSVPLIVLQGKSAISCFVSCANRTGSHIILLLLPALQCQSSVASDGAGHWTPSPFANSNDCLCKKRSTTIQHLQLGTFSELHVRYLALHCRCNCIQGRLPLMASGASSGSSCCFQMQQSRTRHKHKLCRVSHIRGLSTTLQDIVKYLAAVFSKQLQKLAHIHCMYWHLKLDSALKS